MNRRDLPYVMLVEKDGHLYQAYHNNTVCWCNGSVMSIEMLREIYNVIQPNA